MLKFSKKAMNAIPKLFSYRNDVDIFTEDKTADKEFYKSLFANLFKGKLKINDVTPLGCKKNVYDHYDARTPKELKGKYYIVDGDLDLITKSNRAEEKNLIVLDSYCIENYLIDEKGIVELTYLSKGSDDIDKVKKAINFDKWLSYNKSCLCCLFHHLALLKCLGGGKKLKNANDFLKTDKKQVMLDSTKVDVYRDEIKNEILTILKIEYGSKAQQQYEKEIEEIKKRWEVNEENLLKIVSGKSYLLPLLQFRINYCIGKGKGLIPKSSLKLFLAKNSQLDRLKFLTKRIK